MAAIEQGNFYGWTWNKKVKGNSQSITAYDRRSDPTNVEQVKMFLKERSKWKKQTKWKSYKDDEESFSAKMQFSLLFGQKWQRKKLPFNPILNGKYF